MTAVALFSWPIIAIVLFQKLGQVKGVMWATLLGALFLPEAIEYDLPGLPPYDKPAAIIVGLLLGLALSKDPKPALPTEDAVARKIINALCAIYLLSSLITVLANTETLTFGPVTVPALGLRELITMTTQCIVVLVPFLIARRYFGDSERHVELMKAFVIMGLLYTVLILFEARMSPQLHRWTYGYFQHSWIQHNRGGAFRPIVFQPSGLWIGILLLKCAAMSFILLKMKVAADQPKLQYVFVGLWFFAILALSRNFGATILGLLFVPLMWFFGPRLQALVSVSVVVAFLVFPLLRQAEMVTFDRTLEIVGSISQERKQSFEARLENEAMFMARSSIKPLTGWGIWARWRVRDERTGEDLTVSDGRWISVLGERGWIGFIGYFGILCAPILLLLRAKRHAPLSSTATGLGAILAAVLIYQVPNNTVGPLTLILAGALAGYTQRIPRPVVEDEDAEDDPDPGRNRPGYTRFPKAAPPLRQRTPPNARIS